MDGKQMWAFFLDNQTIFFRETQQAFAFLEEMYGYTRLDNAVCNIEDGRDTSAVSRYEHMQSGIMAEWYPLSTSIHAAKGAEQVQEQLHSM